MEKRKRYSPDNGQVLKTRVCFKNIPHNYQDAELREFLLSRLGSSTTITDCRVLKDGKTGKSRGIAFCGFLEESQAQRCIEQLNKTYCKSSRLLVEYATSVKEKSQDKNRESDETKEKTDKTKHETEKTPSILPEKTKVTKRKFWANDDGEDEAEPAPPVLPDVSSDTESSDGSDSDDDADPLKEQSRQTDLDFLRSKKVAVDDFEKDQTEAPRDESSSTDESSDDDETEPDFPQESKTHGEKILGDKSEDAEETPEEDALESISKNRLFLRNLPFTAAEEDIRDFFAAHGTVLECHIPADDQKRSKGFGFVTFEKANDAEAAMSQLDGTDFQGRLLHILPAREAVSKPSQTSQNGGYKDKLEAERKGKALTESAGWSASHVRGDAVVDNLAVRLGLRKGDIMAVKDGLSGGDAAVRLALAETAIIEENRKFFADHGYNMDALVSPSGTTSNARSNTAILVKNLPHDTTKDELAKMFSIKGAEPASILLPPSRTLAVIEYSHGNDAKSAFRRLAFRRFKNVPLYLEWAPLAAVTKDGNQASATEEINSDSNPVLTEEVAENEEDIQISITPTLYVKNLNFKTTEETLHELLSQYVKDVRSIRIPQKRGPTKQGSSTSESQSMGYCFIEFGSSASANKALKILNGKTVDGHALDVKPSAAEMQKVLPHANLAKDSTKLVVRNVPFQANRKELMQLFGSLGHLKKVRMPRKFDGTSRGYAFVEYLTNKEAVAAMKALSRTHLYGRHLVIEWAATDEEANQMDTLRNKAERDIVTPPKNKKIRFD